MATRDNRPGSGPLRSIKVARGRTLKATPVFDTYWSFAAERQRLFVRRVLGSPPPWTDDPVLRRYRFTNAYRAADRVSQYLIRHVLYEGDQAPREVFFRALLFKLFNRVETWQALVSRFGVPQASCIRPELYAGFFDSLLEQGSRLYSAAYIIPSPQLGYARKHRNHLQLLELMLCDQAPSRIADAKSLEAVYAILRSFPSIGPFLGFQFAIDLNYSAIVNFSEMDFVVAGPGARDGIQRCFADTAGLSDADVIRAVSDIREKEFARLGIDFPDLWGRPLQLVDLQNLFCEVDKYSRVVFPSSPGASQRKRIKQLYRSSGTLPPQWYPPKWGLNPPASVFPAFDAQARELLHRGRQQSPGHLTRI
ncbi:nucleotide kinase domain-containing protein [Candidatus Foliamicus sp.]